MSWDASKLEVLVTTIPHRHGKLCELLAAFDAQMMPGAGVLVYRDNLDAPYGQKCQALRMNATARYICFVDDDDLVAPDYIPRIMAAIHGGPDYVGFWVRWTLDGQRQLDVDHSLSHGGWHEVPGRLLRDISHLNPMRRELAVQRPFAGDWGGDHDWAAAMRASGLVRTEVHLDEELYYYRLSSTDGFRTPREPMLAHEIPELPDYPWLARMGT